VASGFIAPFANALWFKYSITAAGKDITILL